MKLIKSHRELDVYNIAFQAAMEIFSISKSFSKEERYSLTDQIRRSSRSVCANIAEAFRKRRYEKSFISKLNDAEAECAETQVWIEFALQCEYIDRESANTLYKLYDNIIGKIVIMINNPQRWKLISNKNTDKRKQSVI
jgi:four helix bundle protein